MHAQSAERSPARVKTRLGSRHWALPAEENKGQRSALCLCVYLRVGAWTTPIGSAWTTNDWFQASSHCLPPSLPPSSSHGVKVFKNLKLKHLMGTERRWLNWSFLFSQSSTFFFLFFLLFYFFFFLFFLCHEPYDGELEGGRPEGIKVKCRVRESSFNK